MRLFGFRPRVLSNWCCRYGPYSHMWYYGMLGDLLRVSRLDDQICEEPPVCWGFLSCRTKTAHYVCMVSIIKSRSRGEPEYLRIPGKYFVFEISPTKLGYAVFTVETT